MAPMVDVEDIERTFVAKKVFSVIDGTAKTRTSGPASPPALFRPNHFTNKFKVSGIDDDDTGTSSSLVGMTHTIDPVPF